MITPVLLELLELVALGPTKPIRIVLVLDLKPVDDPLIPMVVDVYYKTWFASHPVKHPIVKPEHQQLSFFPLYERMVLRVGVLSPPSCSST